MNSSTSTFNSFTQKLKFVGGTLKVSSLDIAEKFGKRHADVLRAIQNLECSESFSRMHFEQSEYTRRGKRCPMYLISRTGFVFLTMGLKGDKPAQFKEWFVGAFNQMERELPKHQPVWPSDQPQLKIIDGVVRVSTVDVAEKFKWTHERFLKATIAYYFDRNLSYEFKKKHFMESEFTDEKGEVQRMYYLTRDAFHLCTTGESGYVEYTIKERYLRAFDEMEKKLQESSRPSFPVNDYAAELFEIVNKLGPECVPQAKTILGALVDMAANAKYLELERGCA